MIHWIENIKNDIEITKKEANGNSGYEKNNKRNWDFLGDSVDKNPPCNARDSGSIPGRETKPMHNYWAPTPQW